MEHLVDTIYEAALAPDLWPAVFAALGERYKTKGGLLFANTSQGPRWIGGGEAADIMRDFMADDWISRHDRLTRLIARRHAGFLANLDLYSPAEMETLPVFTQFLAPRGAAVGAVTLVSGAGNENLFLGIEGFRDHDAAKAAIPELDSLRPHLARAAMLSAQLQLERVKAKATILETIGVPAAFVGEDGALTAANALSELEIGACFVDKRRCLRLMDERADQRLRHALEKVRAGEGGASIAIRGSPMTSARALHVIPAIGDASDLFFRASAVLVVTQRKPAATANSVLLEHLYDLSHAEARVAAAVAAGDSLQKIASRSGISIHTVRNQMKAVLDKTGADGQTDLVTLLLGLALPSANATPWRAAR